MDFRFTNKYDPAGIVKSLSSALHRKTFRNDPSSVFWAYDDFSSYNDQIQNLIVKYLEEFNVSNAIFTLTSKDLIEDKHNDYSIEPLFNAQYKISENKLTLDSIVDNSQDELFLPGPNNYIPDNFDIIYDKDSEYQVLGNGQVILPDSSKSHWPKLYKTEHNNHVYMMPNMITPPKILNQIVAGPKMKLILKFISVKTKVSIEEYLIRSLLDSVLDDALNKLSYQANLAGIYGSSVVRYNYLSLSVSGYSQNQGIFLDEVFRIVGNLEDHIKQEQLDIYIDEKIQALKNSFRSPSYSLGLRLLKRSLSVYSISEDTFLEYLRGFDHTGLNSNPRKYG